MPKAADEQKETRASAGLGLCHVSRVHLGAGGGVLLRVVLVAIAFVPVMEMLSGVMLVAVALVYVVHMPLLFSMMFVAVAFMNVVKVFASVMLVLIALVLVVLRSYHFVHLAQDSTESIPAP